MHGCDVTKLTVLCTNAGCRLLPVGFTLVGNGGPPLEVTWGTGHPLREIGGDGREWSQKCLSFFFLSSNSPILRNVKDNFLVKKIIKET